jgi:hypothetical protein
VNEETGALILSELIQMRRDQQAMLEKVVRIEETVKDVGDHESRLRVLEASIPDEVKVRLSSLEKWKWTATGALAASTASLGAQIYNALKGA